MTDERPYVTGRPTDYRPEYCQMLIDHMSDGYSFETFAPKAKVSVKSIYNWVDQHPAFLQAKKDGKSASRLFWESLGVDAAKGKIENFSAACWIFNMKNRFQWSDRKEVKMKAKMSIEEQKRELVRAMPMKELAALVKENLPAEDVV